MIYSVSGIHFFGSYVKRKNRQLGEIIQEQDIFTSTVE